MDARESYIDVAVQRAKELPTRLAFAVFIASAAALVTHNLGAALWLAAACAAQVADSLINRPLRRQDAAEPVGAARWPYIASAVFNTIVYSSISAFVWFKGGPDARAFAVILPAGGLIHIAMHTYRARSLALAASAPHAAFLMGLPLAWAVSTPQNDFVALSIGTLGGMLFVMHLVVAVRRMSANADALRHAVEVAEAERTRAELASAAKSNFLATISHEIRTPMNAVLAGASLLGKTELSQAQASHVAMLTNASEVLLGLLNDVLDLSKIEARKLELDAVEGDLSAKLLAAAALWAPRAAEKGVGFRTEIEGLPARALFDPLRFQQIVFNLLSNAVKFTERGEVVLRAGALRGGRMFVEVRDSGCGMTPDQAARIFQSFEQAHAGVTRQYGGTGLGLSISRQLAELMGGEISVTSREGEGSVFRVELPVVEARPAAEAAESGQDESADLSRLEILLAEDHAVNQQIVRLYLEPLGCRLTVAEDGAQAVEQAGARPFDIILMDMQMPVMGGVEAARTIRAGHGPNAATPIIALTANAMSEHREEWRAAGAEGFVTKPLDAERLIGAISEALTASTPALAHAAA